MAALLTQAFSPQGASAQGAWTFQNLHTFSDTDGRWPSAALVVGAGGTLYGTTEYGGVNGLGTVFAINQNGSGFRDVASLNIPGAVESLGSLVQGPDGTLYGATQVGGTVGVGGLFSVRPDGTGLVTTHSFERSDGYNPEAGLVFGPGGFLYGTTGYGSANGNVFRINPDGSGLQNLHYFGPNIGVDGINPYAAITVGPGGVLFGTTAYGGAHGYGTVFSLNADGTGYRTLYSFNQTDGYRPLAAVTIGPDGKVYGTTSAGGSANDGTVFSIATDGSGFRSLFSFGPASGSGAYPSAGVTFGPDGNIYGTTANVNGVSGGDTVFEMAPDGTGYHTVHVFGGVDGLSPVGGLVFGSGGTLFGTAQKGGAIGQGYQGQGYGVVYSLSPTPEPSQYTALCLGGVGIAGIALKARRRKPSA